ncbi:flagellar protein FlaG [Polynucleobacter sp. Nonnen-W13]|uniref:flagellar protein FlaG n=1 Tax=Polynucleobacter sp. Nonnen-W13 TaxID=1855625 RepID=UPI001C0D2EDF|nr:flagellar protein FlaG [Polynucleobacter sp. Nonnen-W13]MBU3558474.1 flagellar protein FlaG [Polynucleobacter sp. Nonnen-W13]
MSEITARSVASSAASSSQLNLPKGITSGATGKTNTDAAVVAAAASTEIRPSNVNQVMQPTRETVARAAEQMQKFVSSMGRNLNFAIDGDTGYHIVRVTNPETGEVVRQLPSEEMLRLAHSLTQISALVNQKA